MRRCEGLVATVRIHYFPNTPLHVVRLYRVRSKVQYMDFGRVNLGHSEQKQEKTDRVEGRKTSRVAAPKYPAQGQSERGAYQRMFPF